jgi:hypothetical protein
VTDPEPGKDETTDDPPERGDQDVGMPGQDIDQSHFN